ncbi:MAG: hypothetical protein N2Z75_06640 [Meiothermus sp.]|uniref:hypothetical protein n=1 Tax=Meiothermus sp. TaxID=1955249 RepID=UPI0025D75168|nr:hypothetical protein [Meiothermus sp.]MCS7069541.1 hypothetical protein [Meiothermus sp.]MCX7601599.1 hypothetical protein [Meiothermus sp.]MDW8426068.1 hypothetical protein [Meiothermus sp.]
MSPLIALGLSLYLLNLLVGLAAQFRLGHFGIWHHRLYLVVFVSAVLAVVFSREWWLLLTVGCLALFPKARPRTWLHPTLGVIGLIGYLLALGG